MTVSPTATDRATTKLSNVTFKDCVADGNAGHQVPPALHSFRRIPPGFLLRAARLLCMHDAEGCSSTRRSFRRGLASSIRALSPFLSRSTTAVRMVETWGPPSVEHPRASCLAAWHRGCEAASPS